MENFQYKGNTFAVEKLEYWYRRGHDEYCVSVKEISAELVCLPETYKNAPITEWKEKDAGSGNGWYRNNAGDREKKRVFDKARVLYIPASIRSIRIYNGLFPELERVEIDSGNGDYVTDGRLIISRKDNELAYCPVCKGRDMEIPESVRKIQADAFFGTQYEEIRFPKKEPEISADAFRGSKWLDMQKGAVVIGSMLYKFPEDMQELVVPRHVRRFHPEVFKGCHSLKKLVTPIMPLGRDIENLERWGRCSFLTITSGTAHINIALLRKWHSLEKVVVADGHKKYRTLDGVVYSRDGRILVWYPAGKKGEMFAVPEGVRKIGEFAFENQGYLKKVLMPESVVTLGTGAFSGCRNLEDIGLSSGIREIPDAGTYRGAGVFAECQKLRRIVLPDKLSYLGSFAFYNSGLRSIVLGEGLEQIGEYALMAAGLKEIILPPGVKRVGKGALFYVEKAEVYEGTAKGIVAAVNTNWPDMKNNTMNLKWSGCRIVVRHRRSEKREHFLIPESLKKNAAYHLEIAWNGEHIDYEEYDQCLEEITDSEEKLEFAEQGLRRFREGEDNTYLDYMRRVSLKMGFRLLEEGKEKEFLLFLKQDFLSENALLKLLKCSNERGETVCSAYITETLSRKKRKSSSFRI